MKLFKKKHYEKKFDLDKEPQHCLCWEEVIGKCPLHKGSSDKERANDGSLKDPKKVRKA